MGSVTTGSLAEDEFTTGVVCAWSRSMLANAEAASPPWPPITIAVIEFSSIHPDGYEARSVERASSRSGLRLRETSRLAVSYTE